MSGDLRRGEETVVTTIRDAHCHFFSAGFFRALTTDRSIAGADAADSIPARLNWYPPGTDEQLADRWIAELDRHSVERVMLIASMAGDERSVAAASRRHPSRIVGAFMADPAAPDAAARFDRAFGEYGLGMVCLFPAMHHVPVDDPRTAALFGLAERHRRAVFVHCGVLSVGVRTKLGLPSRFDLRLGDPLAVAASAVKHPDVPFIIPHFGAGFFREALMAVAATSNIYLDTSSSNSWVKYLPGLTLRDVFARALDVAGPSRLLFGTDSSFFPRGWQKRIHDDQRAILTDLDVSADDQALIFGGNFLRIFGG